MDMNLSIPQISLYFIVPGQLTSMQSVLFNIKRPFLHSLRHIMNAIENGQSKGI